MTKLSPDDLVVRVAAAHERERLLLDHLTDSQVRAASALPGWTRGHVLAARLAFLRAASRQVTHAMAGRMTEEFYDGGRAGRDAEIDANAGRPADDLVLEVTQAAKALDRAWSAMGPIDWDRPIMYRGRGPLTDLVRASWREVEVHRVDLDLGIRPSDWSADFCAELFDFLTPRIPAGVQARLVTPDGRTWKLGTGEPVEIRGALTDLAAWLSGRSPAGPVESSTGTLPELQRLRVGG
jgi:maleylpyruvate isomerase